jgi:hypothetical protein
MSEILKVCHGNEFSDQRLQISDVQVRDLPVNFRDQRITWPARRPLKKCRNLSCVSQVGPKNGISAKSVQLPVIVSAPVEYKYYLWTIFGLFDTEFIHSLSLKLRATSSIFAVNK